VSGEKLIAEDVYIIDDVLDREAPVVGHLCPDNGFLTEMTLRENESGPMYWCRGCGYILEEGLSMAVRLNEVNI
jgi:hypothetical protein